MPMPRPGWGSRIRRRVVKPGTLRVDGHPGVERREDFQLGVDRGHVIGVVEVLIDELPVALDVEVQGRGIVEGAEVVITGAPGERFPVILEFRRVARDVDEDEVMPDGMAHRHQTRRVPSGIRIVAAATEKMGAHAQAAVEAVDPRMIGTGQDRLAPAPFRHHDRPAMPADIVEDPDHAVVIAHDDERHAGHLHRRDVSRLGNVVTETGKHPCAGEDSLVLRLQPLGAGVAFVGKAAAVSGRRPEPRHRRFVQNPVNHLVAGD